MEKGMIHVYCGNGKGKTSILNGMVIRGLGAGFNIKYVRFLKNRETAENKIIEKLGVHVESFYDFSSKFIWEMNDEERKQFKKETREGFEKFCEYLKDDSIDLVLADEILGTVENKFITEEELIDALKNKSEHVEVALSGRKIFDGLKKISNLVSSVEPIKHYFDEGVNARTGIEF